MNYPLVYKSNFKLYHKIIEVQNNSELYNIIIKDKILFKLYHIIIEDKNNFELLNIVLENKNNIKLYHIIIEDKIILNYPL